MTKEYEINTTTRTVNRFMSFLVKLGLAPKGIHLLTVPGRKTGNLYTTPVTLVIKDGRRWLVAPYGEVGWTINARAAGQVKLERGRKTEMSKIKEVAPEKRAPILKAYLALEPITRPYFIARPDSPLEKFAAEAERHPVFELITPDKTGENDA
ncbi:MAG: nitroreductase family deazaflavin-dependent oxidoreductase [Anaerolineales bacterium]|nr:nitroreductase family deazaflavin-dependent oxidoreductase [Anaerolineales bacterium]